MQSLEFAVPLASNRKVVRQFASNPKGREHNPHGRWRLQRTKGTVRISDGLLIFERFQRLQPAHDPERAQSDSGDSGRAAYRRSIG